VIEWRGGTAVPYLLLEEYLRMKWLLSLTALLAFTASAADVTGTWKGTVETPNGTVERTFVFKVAGTTLTGETTSQMMGKSVINDGKVEGDSISFTIDVKFQENEMKLNYKGKVNGDTIKFTVEGPNGMTLEYDAKRVV
jgi:hypothetical protein